MTGQYIIGAEGLLKNLTDGNMGAVRYSVDGTKTVSYTHLTLPTKRIV